MANKEVKTVQEMIQNESVLLFDKAMEYSVSGVENKEGKDGSITPKKVYNFVNPVGNRTTLTTYDADIIKSTEKIALALHGKKILNFAICREMARLNTPEKLDAMGFSSIKDYGKALFDFSGVTSNQYARIGKIFINDNYKIISDVLPQSLTKGHLLELLPYVGENEDISDIEQLYLDGVLTDGLGTQKMRAKLKAWKNGELAIETTAEELPTSGEELPDADEKENKAKPKTGETTPITNNADFDLQSNVASILHKCNEIKAFFDDINSHDFKVAGYEKALETITALATTLITE